GSPTVAAAAAAARSLFVLAKLGGVTLSAFPDLPIRASALRHHGVGYLEGLQNGFESILKGRRSGEQRAIADSLGVGSEGATGSTVARFSAVGGIPGRLSNLVDKFFRLNLLTWWTDAMKTGAGLMLARNLARNVGNGWDALAPDLRRSLGRYGIDAGAWE